MRREHMLLCISAGRPASRNPPRFEYEGAFRSWQVRVLIDEALVILRERRSRRHCESVHSKRLGMFVCPALNAMEKRKGEKNVQKDSENWSRS